MNDAEFCSDAHRHSYAEEQQLAMRRLTETHPSLQRTQRVPAVQVAPAAPAAPVAAMRMVSMAIMGEFFPAGPGAVSPPPPQASEVAPVFGHGVIQIVERERRVTSGAPFSGDVVPVPLSPSNFAIRGVAAPQRPLPVQIVPPRRGNGSPGRNLSALAARTGLRPLPARAAGAQPRPAVSLSLASSGDLRVLPAGHRRRALALPACRRLAAIPALPASARPEPLRRERFESASSAQAGFALALPSAPFALIAPVASPPAEPDPEIWEILEQSGLAALLAATGIAPVVAAAPAAQALPVPAEPYDAFLPEPEAALVAAMRPARGNRHLDAVAVLRTLSAPRPVAAPPPPRSKARPVAGPAARHLPVFASRARILALSPVVETCPVEPPLPVSTPRDAAAGLRPLPPSGLPAPWEAETAIVRYSRLSVLTRRGILPVEPPAPRGARSAPVSSPTPFAAAYAPAAPSVQLAPRLRQVAATAGRPVAICVASVDYRPAPRPLPAAPPAVSVGIPSYARRMLIRSARAGCLRLAPPPPAASVARPQSVSHVDLIPSAGIPAASLQPRSRALRSISVRLYRVPGAQATPRDSRIRPLALGFDLWGSAPAICAAGLAWDDGKPRPKSRRGPRLPGNPFSRFSSTGLSDAWSKVRRLPSDLKWIAMVVPLIIGIWAIARPSDEPAPRKVAEAAAPRPVERPDDEQAAISPVATPVPIAKAEPAPPPPEIPAELPKEDRTAPVRAIPPANPSAWDTFTARVASRASVDLVEDFQRGLSHWDGRGEWARTWTYDRSGTVRPGHMAFFQPSVGLRDYVMEMKASIDRRVIQWLVRASGPQNYHFARLNVTPGAPLTKLEFERWSVVNGRTGRVTRLPLPHAGANQTLFDIRVEVKGDTVTTYLQDQVIDTFSDPRLPEGGIGLVGAGDDRPRIYGLRVYHQNDFLGKLCSFFASPPIASQGSE